MVHQTIEDVRNNRAYVLTISAIGSGELSMEMLRQYTENPPYRQIQNLLETCLSELTRLNHPVQNSVRERLHRELESNDIDIEQVLQQVNQIYVYVKSDTIDFEGQLLEDLRTKFQKIQQTIRSVSVEFSSHTGLQPE